MNARPPTYVISWDGTQGLYVAYLLKPRNRREAVTRAEHRRPGKALKLLRASLRQDGSKL